MACGLHLVSLLILLLVAICGAFRTSPGMGIIRGVGEGNVMRLLAETKPAPADDPYLVHVCISCDYEYDEAKGFKKRMPPGTRFRDVETFNCPVCGASINQFKVKEEK